jgi:hypothetical protein
LGGSAGGLDELVTTMRRTAKILRDHGIPFALCGGLAAYARGGWFPDQDVDFLIRESDRPAALQAMAQAGLRIEEPPEEWLVKAYDGDILVDLIYRLVDRPVTEALLADSDELLVAATRLPVMSATELTCQRLQILGPQTCDLTVALGLVRAIREQIDFEQVRQRMRVSPYARAFLFLLTELDIAPERTA